MTLAGATGGVTEGTTGASRVGVMISGIPIFGAELGSDFGSVFAPDIAGSRYTAGSIVGLCGIDGLGATGVLKRGKSVFCLVGGDKEATTSPGESENLTKMGLETR